MNIYLVPEALVLYAAVVSVLTVGFLLAYEAFKPVVVSKK